MDGSLPIHFGDRPDDDGENCPNFGSSTLPVRPPPSDAQYVDQTYHFVARLTGLPFRLTVRPTAMAQLECSRECS